MRRRVEIGEIVGGELMMLYTLVSVHNRFSGLGCFREMCR